MEECRLLDAALRMVVYECLAPSPRSAPLGATLWSEALLTAHGGREAHLINPEQARLVIDQAPHNAVDAIHTLSLIMAVGPVVAIILALWLIKPARTETP